MIKSRQQRKMPWSCSAFCSAPLCVHPPDNPHYWGSTSTNASCCSYFGLNISHAWNKRNFSPPFYWFLLMKTIYKVMLCSEIAVKANMAQSKHLYDTHRYNSILCQDETQSPGKRGWRAGTSLRTWVAHSVTEACCTPSVWSLWQCGHMSCSHHSWPCRECSVPPARLGLHRCSEDSKHQGSRWCRRQYGNRPGKSWKGNPICE